MSVAYSFVSLETTGFNLDKHETWELTVIKRLQGGPDTEVTYQIRPDLTLASKSVLNSSDFHARFKVPPKAEAAVLESGRVQPVARRSTLRDQLSELLGDTILVTADVPQASTFLRKLLARNTPWVYPPISVLDLAAGWLLANGRLVTAPWLEYQVSRKLGLPLPDTGTAAEAGWVRDVFDRLFYRRV